MNKRIISADTPDTENPEWTGEAVASAQPAREVLPQVFSKARAEALLAPHGRETHIDAVLQQLIAERPATR